jgi:mannose-P-dolichol utilization defect protein 1
MAVAPVAAPVATAAGAAAAAAVGGSTSEAVAVLLGYAVLAGSLFRSAPQIVKVVRARSCEGLSLTSVIVELLCYSVVVAYNLAQGYAFNTFGEVVACWVQDVVLIALILRFSRTPGWVAALVFGSLAALSAWLLSPACPRPVLAALQASTIITMALGSRLPQIILNWRRGNAGMLSVMSCGLNVAGNAARIFTTLVLTRDPLLLGGIVTQGARLGGWGLGCLIWFALQNRVSV